MIVYSVVIVFIAPLGGWLSDRLGSRLPCTAGSACTAVSILFMTALDLDSRPVDVMLPLMGMGLGWCLFASPNLNAIFGSVTSNRLGAVSGLTVTAANIRNGLGIGLGTLFFIRWLDHYGVDFKSSAAYSSWIHGSEAYLASFQFSWMIISVLAFLAVVASFVRGERKDASA